MNSNVALAAGRAMLTRCLKDIEAGKDSIAPDMTPFNPPSAMEVFKLLPRKAGCARCGYPDCMAFAVALVKEETLPEACPVLVEAPASNGAMDQLKSCSRAEASFRGRGGGRHKMRTDIICKTMLSIMFLIPLALAFQLRASEPASDGGPVLPEGPLTLDQLIEFALANNPDVAMARQEVQAAEARHDQAAGARLPDVSVQSSYAHHLDEQRILPILKPEEPTILSRDLVAADIVLTVPLFTGGRLVNQVSAAELLRESAEHRLARSREELSFSVASLYYSILYQRRAIESIEFSRQALTEHLARVNSLVEMRKAAPVDKSRIEVAIADLEEKLLREKNLMAVMQGALANFLGVRDFNGPIQLQGKLEIEGQMKLPEPEAAYMAAMAHREDYLALHSEVQALEREVKVAEAGRWPSVTLYGAYGGRWAVGETYGEGDKFGDIGQVGVNVNIPLYDGGQVGSRVREERAKLAASQERLRKLELQIRLEVETALLNAQSSLKRIEVTRRAILLARENLEIERQKYELSKGVIVDVLDSQAALLGAQTNHYRAVADYFIAESQLRLAMGEMPL